MACFDEKGCYIGLNLVIYIIGITIILIIFGEFLKHSRHFDMSNKNEDRHLQFIQGSSLIAGFALFFAIFYELLTLILHLVFASDQFEKTDGADALIMITSILFAATKSIGYYYVIRSTQLAYGELEQSSGNSKTQLQAINPSNSSKSMLGGGGGGYGEGSVHMDPLCCCCKINSGTQWAENGISTFTIDQMSLLSAYFLIQFADSFGDYLSDDYNDFFRFLAVVTEYGYIVFLITFVFQRYLKKPVYKETSSIRRVTFTNGLFVSLSIVFSVIRGVLHSSSDYNGMKPSNGEFWTIDFVALLSNVVMAVAIGGGFVDSVYNKFFCCCKR